MKIMQTLKYKLSLECQTTHDPVLNDNSEIKRQSSPPRSGRLKYQY